MPPLRSLLKSLAFRIGASVVAIEVAVLIGIGALAVERLSEEMDRRTRDRITLPGTLMDRGVLSYEAVSDWTIMTNLIGQELVDGMVVGANWNVFHALDPSHLGQDVRRMPGIEASWFNPRSRASTLAEVDDGRSTFLVAVTPLYVRGTEVPTLYAYIKVNTTALIGQKLDLLINVALASLLCVVLTSAIIVLMLRVTVLRRIGGLSGFVRRVGAGESDVPALAVGPDELGLLEEGVNRMASQLDQRARLSERAQENLRESELRFRDFAASSSDWFWELDAELRYVTVSDRFFALVRPALSPIGRSVEELGVDPVEPDGWRRLKALLDRREPVQDFDVTWWERTAEGGSVARFARLSGLPVFDRALRFTGYRGTGRDITLQHQARATLEQRVEERTAALTLANHELQETLSSLSRAQAELVRSEKLASLGALVAGVAHEINTPVGVAVTAASHLTDRTKDVRQQLENNDLRRGDLEGYLDTADEAAKLLLTNMERASALIQSFKQVATDRTSEMLRPFELRRYLEDIVHSLSPALRRTRHRVAVECPPGIEMTGYPGLLSQVVTNLMMNSLVHGYGEGESGTLRLTVRENGPEQVEIVYADDGHGIDPANLPKIFDPFFTTRRGAGSTGLGLNIVHNIVTGTLCGTIAVASRRGEGVAFTLRMPKVLNERAEAALAY